MSGFGVGCLNGTVMFVCGRRLQASHPTEFTELLSHRAVSFWGTPGKLSFIPSQVFIKSYISSFCFVLVPYLTFLKKLIL